MKVKIVIRTKNLKLDKALKDYIEEKIGGLEKFVKIFQNEEKYYNGFFKKGKPRAEVWIEIGRTTLHHQKGSIFRAEAQLRLPGKSLVAEAEAGDLKLAIVEVKDELQRQLKKYKDRATAQTKRRARVFKKLIRLSPLARFRRKKGGRTREEGI